MQDPKKSPKIVIWAPSHNFVGLSSQLRHVSVIGKNLLSSNISPTCSHNMVNFGPLAAEMVSLVWGTPGNFNGCRVLAALLHGTLVVGVSQTAALNRGATYIRQGGHHVGHWPTFLVILDLADDQVIDHTTHYHVTDLDSWLPGLVKPFITSLRLCLSHA